MATEAGRSSSVLSVMLGSGRLAPEINLLAAAEHHRLELLLFDSLLKRERIPTRVRAMGIEALERAAQQNSYLLRELCRVTSRLAEAGIPALSLKGPLLALLLWDDLRLRRSRDIDLLVSSKNLVEAVRILNAAGYRSLSTPGGLLRQVELTHEDEGFALDLHWNITHGEMPFPLDFDDLWADRREILCNGAMISALSAEWLFVVSNMYLIKSYPWPELVYLSDLARLIQRFPDMNWDRVGTLAAQTGTRRLCAVGLALVDALEGRAVPERARAQFPASAAVRSTAQKVRRAAEDSSGPDPASDDNGAAARRLRRILSHPAFRERPLDKARAYASLVPLLLMPGRPSAGQGWTEASLIRLGRLAGAAATSLAATLSPLPRVGSGVYAAAPGTRFYPLDGAGILLSAQRKELFALSASAAFLWCGLQEGLSRRTIVRQLAAFSGQSRKDARTQVDATLRDWRKAGLLGSGTAARSRSQVPQRPDPRQRSPADIPSPGDAAGSAPLQRRRYRLLSTTFEVCLPGDALADTLDSAIGHLSATGTPQAIVSVTRPAAEFLISVDRRIVDSCADAVAVVPTLKSVLTVEAVNREDFGLYLHAAMLQEGGNALLLPAPPQSGKTCLAAVLAKAGLAYCTDETTLLDPQSFAARGLRTAMAVKASGWHVLQPFYPALEALPVHRRADGKIVKYLRPPRDRRLANPDCPCRVRCIVFPRFIDGGTNELVPLPKVTALHLLMEECIAMRLEFTEAQVQSLVEWLDTVACYSLSYRDLSAAVEQILECMCMSAMPEPAVGQSSTKVVA